MKEMILKDSLDFDDLIEKIKKEQFDRLHWTDIKFFVFNNLKKSIIYGMSNNPIFTYDNLSKMSNQSNKIYSDEIAKVLALDDEESYTYMIQIFNPFQPREFPCGVIILKKTEEFSVQEMKKLDFLLIFLAFNNIQLTINNFNRIYNLINVFTNMINVKDVLMPYHMTNVANLSVKIGTYLDLSLSDLKILYFSALLHDIGKLYIPDKIMNSKKELGIEEFEEIKKHAQKSAEIISSVLYGTIHFNMIPNIVRYHHENYDGSGYPNGLKKREIPFMSRIIRVADTIDAISSKKVYKTSEKREEIINELVRESGILYDPIIVDAGIQAVLNNQSYRSLERSFEGTYFIPNVTLSYVNTYTNNRESIIGNILINHSEAEFLIHEEKNRLFVTKLMKKAMIGFIEHKDFIEYSVEISRYHNHIIYLKSLKRHPTDRTFSLVWDSIVKVGDIDKRFRFEGNLIKLGGEICLIKMDAKHSKWTEKEQSCAYEIYLDEMVDGIEIHMMLNGKIVNYYDLEDGTVFVFYFYNISPMQKDRIMQILFRKEILSQQKTSYVNLKI